MFREPETAASSRWLCTHKGSSRHSQSRRAPRTGHHCDAALPRAADDAHRHQATAKNAATRAFGPTPTAAGSTDAAVTSLPVSVIRLSGGGGPRPVTPPYCPRSVGPRRARPTDQPPPPRASPDVAQRADLAARKRAGVARRGFRHKQVAERMAPIFLGAPREPWTAGQDQRSCRVRR